MTTATTYTQTNKTKDSEPPLLQQSFHSHPFPTEGEEAVNKAKNGVASSADDDDEESDSDGSDGENESELKFTLSSNSSGNIIDPNVSLSPSDDLFFKGRLVPIDSSLTGAEPNPRSQFPVSLIKSATKFRVMMLKFKKSKSNVSEKTDSTGSGSENLREQPEENQHEKRSQKFFTVKFKVEEVPIVSMFTRDNSSKCVNSKVQKVQKPNPDDSASDEKLFSKDTMQRYLKKVKPMYIRASKRYGDKLKFSGQLSLSGAAKAGVVPPPPPPPPPSTAAKTEKLPAATEAKEESTETASNAKSQKHGSNLPAAVRVVCKTLGKSRSASAAVAAAAPPGTTTTSKRRDDSLLQQQDGIQSAILHCKRSFKAARGEESSKEAKETCI
ncbi:hypothetical protein RJ639_011052 [Escallonia herrerae]|uniref:Membrane-associated kinase regulator 2 n=1 Tax=Escallonia herrerae TaxID=1293975 RepID=A0AA88VLP7_9ASTE|nr:hypothetical protein RJ639_011052 [Escallonia herrerae]